MVKGCTPNDEAFNSVRSYGELKGPCHSLLRGVLCGGSYVVVTSRIGLHAVAKSGGGHTEFDLPPSTIHTIECDSPLYVEANGFHSQALQNQHLVRILSWLPKTPCEKWAL